MKPQSSSKTSWLSGATCVALALGSLLASQTAQSQVIASDNFSEGTVGTQIYETGTAGSGWANEWADKNSLDRVQSGPLAYTDSSGNVLATSGNSLQSNGAANPGTSSSEPERTFSTTFGADALANTADPNTVWISYLWQGGNTSASGSLFRQASVMFLKGASTTSTSPGGTEYMDVGMPNITSGTGSVLPNVSLWFNSGNVGSGIPSTAPLQSTAAYTAANSGLTQFILIEMTGTATAWGTTGGSETVNVWVDPTLTQGAPSTAADITYTGQDLSSINAIRLQGGGYNSTYGTLPGEETVSDFIVGNTALDVEPIVAAPEPGTVSLAIVGGLGLLTMIRRKK